jgi:hypothetical protein
MMIVVVIIIIYLTLSVTNRQFQGDQWQFEQHFIDTLQVILVQGMCLAVCTVAEWLACASKQVPSYLNLFNVFRYSYDCCSLQVKFTEMKYGIHMDEEFRKNKDKFHSAKANITRIFALQKRALRYTAGLKHLDSCRNSFRNLNILTVYSLYIQETILYVKKSVTAQ